MPDADRIDLSPAPAAPGTTGGGAARTAAVELRDVTKRYGREVLALDAVSLQVPRGRFLSVMGPSGSGKSTLLHCASGLEAPTSGTVTVAGRDLGRLGETRRTELRREHVGFVFQSYDLLPSLTVEQNLTLPLRLAGRSPDRTWLRGLVERVGLAAHLRQRPGELSGGQQQRAAIVRALACRPDVVFADEPTGALDLRTGREVLRLFRGLVDELGQTVVMVTHDPAAAAQADDAVVMADGRVRDVVRAPTAEELANRLAML